MYQSFIAGSYNKKADEETEKNNLISDSAQKTESVLDANVSADDISQLNSEPLVDDSSNTAVQQSDLNNELIPLNSITKENIDEVNATDEPSEITVDEIIQSKLPESIDINQENKTVPGKGDELNDLISALKAQSDNTVKGGNKNNGKFTSLLKEVLNTQPDVSTQAVKSNILPKSAPITGLDLNDPFCTLVNSVANYIKELIDAKNEFIENNKSKSAGQTSHIESISSLISDLSHRNSPQTENKIADDQNSSDPDDFKLTEQKESEELSIDEQLRQAQLAALALDEQQKELNEKLKAEAKLLNEQVDAQQIINEAEQSLNGLKKTDSEQFVSSDESLIELDSSTSEENSSQTAQLDDCYSVIEVCDIFDEKSEQNTVTIRKDIPDLYSVIATVNSNISNCDCSTDNTSLKNYSEGLLKAVNDSLSGVFGTNRNIVDSTASSKDTNNSVALASAHNDSSTDIQTIDYTHHNAEYNDDDDTDDSTDSDESESSNTTASIELPVAIDIPKSSQINASLSDGNPMSLKASNLELIEQEQNYENRALGRKLETKDFYPDLLREDDWYQDIINAGYSSGPTYSALCYSNRIKNSEYDWTIQMSSDMNLLLQAPDFHHNLRTKFSIYIGHPIELKLESYNGIPPNCPEDKARHCYLNTIDKERKAMLSNNKLKLFVEHLGDDLSTVNLGLYTQLDKPSK